MGMGFIIFLKIIKSKYNTLLKYMNYKYYKNANKKRNTETS